jgi:hypothetical protein
VDESKHTPSCSHYHCTVFIHKNDELNTLKQPLRLRCGLLLHWNVRYCSQEDRNGEIAERNKTVKYRNKKKFFLNKRERNIIKKRSKRKMEFPICKKERKKNERQ